MDILHNLSLFLEKYPSIDNLLWPIHTLYRYLRWNPKMELRTLDVHLVEHCNLNCKNCNHFSPLSNKEFLDLNIFERDISRLAALFNSNIPIINLMGGEPLLHPLVSEFFGISRKYFPTSTINLVTNGILLFKQKTEFWDLCRDHGITIAPTIYPLNIDYTALSKICSEHRVDLCYFRTDPNHPLVHFPLDLSGKQNGTYSYRSCPYRGAFQIYHGKLYPCCRSPNIHHFNKFFLSSLPEDNFIDIYSVESADDIMSFFENAIPLCQYCNVLKITKGHSFGISKKSLDEWT